MDEAIVPEPGSPFAIPAASPVTGSISGLVVDENDIPVNGASVNYGSTSETTDARGMFSFNNVTLDKYTTTVTVTQPGYFKAFRSFSATPSRNFVSIKLLPKTLSGTVSSNTAGTVNLPNGAEIGIQANSMIVKATGAAYTGQVKVFASYIDPTSADISSVVPGSFIGRDANNLYNLQSAGMIAVDLESPSGEPLQLATGTTASIKLPIPSSLLNKAPSTIDTWSLNDQGVWKKEATASRSGDYYQMQVTHFSFWNCDVPANAIYLTLHIQDQSGNALTNMLVSLTVPNNTTWWATTYGITDSMGNVSGLVPANQELVFNAYPNIYNCNSSVNTQTIGPFSANTSLTVTASIAAAQTFTVSGTATGCNSQPLQNGTAIIHSDLYNYIYVPVINGNYSGSLLHCASINAVSVTVIDNSSGAQASTGDVAVSGNAVVLPVINVCGTQTQTAIFVFGNGQGSCNVQTSSGTYMAGTPLNANNIVGVSVNVSVPGTYNITTTTLNGITFSASGVFTTIGTQTVFLSGSGTPLAGGSNTFQTISGTLAGCVFVIFVNSPPLPQAVYDLGGPGACNGTTIAGNYYLGVSVSNSNTVSFTINVISTGTYFINTGNPVNGLQFTDSGYFATTGPRIVLLHASGTPINAGTFTYTPSGSNGTNGCTFDVTPATSGSNAIFNFVGTPGSCPAAIINGTFTSGTALNGGNTVTLTVSVIAVGTFSIQCATTNGFNFSNSSVFTSTGIQTVVLQGTGTPAQSGLYTFIPSGGNVTGCPFIVTVN